MHWETKDREVLVASATGEWAVFITFELDENQKIESFTLIQGKDAIFVPVEMARDLAANLRMK